jgi:dihydroflavonol-4-reductase
MSPPLFHDGPILVTGATGFAGGHIARTLAQRGCAVRALVRPHGDVSGLVQPGIELVHGELTRRDDVIRAAEGAGAIFHIAAAYRTARQPDSYFYDVNVGGTENVIAAMERQGVPRLVHCSTAGVHGHVIRSPATEEAPFNPGDVYQASKLEAERSIRVAMERGVRAVIVRPGAIYGPGDMRLLKLFRSIQQGRFIMFGSGEVNYHLVYVDDLVEGMILSAVTPAVGQTFILAGPRYTSLRELVRLVAQAVRAPAPRWRVALTPLMAAAAICEGVCRPLRLEPPLHRRRADFFVKNRAFSIDKARRLLGYDPRIEPEEGLRRTARWYASQGLIAPVADGANIHRLQPQEVAW